MNPPLLRVRSLATEFTRAEGAYRVVDDVDLDVAEGETVALVGESGSGKTIAARSVLRLLPRGAAIVGGTVEFRGTQLRGLPEREMRQIRGTGISLIMQDPLTALNPVYTIGTQIGAALRRRGVRSRAERRRAVRELLQQVELPPDTERSYAHQLSGGMRQRAAIAVAIAPEPKLLIADEPTTALDVTVQQQIVDLLLRLRAERGMSILFITHDLALASEVCDRIVVMYAGGVVETGHTRVVVNDALHPYTEALLSAAEPEVVTSRLPVIGGRPPNPADPPGGCAFHPRCVDRLDRCPTTAPPAYDLGADRHVTCWLYDAAR